jgi:hypothetical protein
VLQPLPHSPELEPSDLSSFGPFNKVFAAGVINRLHALDLDIFTKGFDALVAHWDKCLISSRQYVEK